MSSLNSSGPVQATIRYTIADRSVRPEDRGLFAGPAHKSSEEVRVSLYDPVTTPEIIQGPQGLDIQGFAYVKHQSALSEDAWLQGTNVEETYVPEVEDLVRRVTGAKRVVVNHVGIRKRLPVNNNDPTFFRKAGDKHEEAVRRLTTQNSPWVNGRQDAGLEPARYSHCDYTLRGMKRTARYCRKDIVAAAQEALDAEDKNTELKRYAAYSVWRPIKPVRRDPLAVADWRTTNPSTLEAMEYRATSNILESGEYMLELLTQTPKAKDSGQKWYCKPNQTPDDVLFVKFADTASETDPNIAAGCVHCSPVLDEPTGEEPRMSVEARVMAFW